MFEKEFNSINNSDIEQLIVNKTAESIKLDYKETLSIQSDENKKEFLADVSSFANSSGGIIAFGIREGRDGKDKPTGIPEEARGLADLNEDETKLRIESILRDNLSPRISGIQIKKIGNFHLGPVLIIRIPHSWNAPHMITFKGSQKFYSRGNSGKFLMDIAQIRAAFTFSESLSEKIRNFQQDRVARIQGGLTPAQIRGDRKFILHLIPLSAFRQDISIDVTVMKKYESQLATLSSSIFTSKINLDGLLIYSSFLENVDCYAQIYRNGIVELADAVVLGCGRDNIQTIQFEKATISILECYLKFFNTIGIQGPVIITAALLGVNDIKLKVFDGQFIPPGYYFDRDLIILPEVLAEDLSAPSDIILKSLFDSIYNAAGWDKCKHYNPQGRWSA